MSTIVRGKNGKPVILLNPKEKANKAAIELKRGIHLTNSGKVKLDKNGRPRKLTKTEAAFRSGQLSMAKAARRAYNAKNKKNSGLNNHIYLPYSFN